MATTRNTANSTITYVDEIPPCDFCRRDMGIPNNPALIDGKTALGSWANMCLYHYTELGTGLGLGLGQLLYLDA